MDRLGVVAADCKLVSLAVVVQVAIQKPGFFEEAGLLWAKLYHYLARRA